MRIETAELQRQADNLAKCCAEAAVRYRSDEMFESAYHYDCFVGSWRESKRRLARLREELATRFDREAN